LLTLYTTPVIYLYLDRVQAWLSFPATGRIHHGEEAQATAAQ
jgi:hypothetical protein